jgi:hypothetical protein
MKSSAGVGEAREEEKRDRRKKGGGKEDAEGYSDAFLNNLHLSEMRFIAIIKFYITKVLNYFALQMEMNW